MDLDGGGGLFNFLPFWGWLQLQEVQLEYSQLDLGMVFDWSGLLLGLTWVIDWHYSGLTLEQNEPQWQRLFENFLSPCHRWKMSCSFLHRRCLCLCLRISHCFRYCFHS